MKRLLIIAVLFGSFACNKVDDIKPEIEKEEAKKERGITIKT